ncbi:MAG: DUF4326 domain-containing protein [Gemmatimonadota bacterium]
MPRTAAPPARAPSAPPVDLTTLPAARLDEMLDDARKALDAMEARLREAGRPVFTDRAYAAQAREIAAISRAKAQAAERFAVEPAHRAASLPLPFRSPDRIRDNLTGVSRGSGREFSRSARVRVANPAPPKNAALGQGFLYRPCCGSTADKTRFGFDDQGNQLTSMAHYAVCKECQEVNSRFAPQDFSRLLKLSVRRSDHLSLRGDPDFGRLAASAMERLGAEVNALARDARRRSGRETAADVADRSNPWTPRAPMDLAASLRPFSRVDVRPGSQELPEESYQGDREGARRLSDYTQAVPAPQGSRRGLADPEFAHPDPEGAVRAAEHTLAFPAAIDRATVGGAPCMAQKWEYVEALHMDGEWNLAQARNFRLVLARVNEIPHHGLRADATRLLMAAADPRVGELHVHQPSRTATLTVVNMYDAPDPDRVIYIGRGIPSMPSLAPSPLANPRKVGSPKPGGGVWEAGETVTLYEAELRAALDPRVQRATWNGRVLRDYEREDMRNAMEDIYETAATLGSVRVGCSCKQPGRVVPCHGDAVVRIAAEELGLNPDLHTNIRHAGVRIEWDPRAGNPFAPYERRRHTGMIEVGSDGEATLSLSPRGRPIRTDSTRVWHSGQDETVSPAEAGRLPLHQQRLEAWLAEAKRIELPDFDREYPLNPRASLITDWRTAGPADPEDPDPASRITPATQIARSERLTRERQEVLRKAAAPVIAAERERVAAAAAAIAAEQAARAGLDPVRTEKHVAEARRSATLDQEAIERIRVAYAAAPHPALDRLEARDAAIEALRPDLDTAPARLDPAERLLVEEAVRAVPLSPAEAAHAAEVRQAMEDYRLESAPRSPLPVSPAERDDQVQAFVADARPTIARTAVEQRVARLERGYESDGRHVPGIQDLSASLAALDRADTALHGERGAAAELDRELATTFLDPAAVRAALDRAAPEEALAMARSLRTDPHALDGHSSLVAGEVPGIQTRDRGRDAVVHLTPEERVAGVVRAAAERYAEARITLDAEIRRAAETAGLPAAPTLVEPVSAEAESHMRAHYASVVERAERQVATASSAVSGTAGDDVLRAVQSARPAERGAAAAAALAVPTTSPEVRAATAYVAALDAAGRTPAEPASAARRADAAVHQARAALDARCGADVRLRIDAADPAGRQAEVAALATAFPPRPADPGTRQVVDRYLRTLDTLDRAREANDPARLQEQVESRNREAAESRTAVERYREPTLAEVRVALGTRGVELLDRKQDLSAMLDRLPPADAPNRSPEALQIRWSNLTQVQRDGVLGALPEGERPLLDRLVTPPDRGSGLAAPALQGAFGKAVPGFGARQTTGGMDR